MRNSDLFIILGIAFFYFCVAVFIFLKYYLLRQDVHLNREFLASVFWDVEEAIFYFGKKDNLLFINGFAKDIVKDRKVVEGKRLSEVLTLYSHYSQEPLDFHSLTDLQVETAFKAYVKEGEEQHEIRKFIGRIKPFFYKHHQYLGYAVILKDVTEVEKAHEIIHQMKNYDAVTGAPNKNYFYDYLNLSIQAAKLENKMMCLLVLDLDNFNRINDIRGHSIGDALLKHVASEIKNCLSNGIQVARIGGDEFTIVIPGLEKINDVVALARNIMGVFRKPWKIEGKDFYITASLGIAIYPYDGNDAETLMSHADTALHNAKEAGKNTYKFYTRNMNASISERFDVETNLRHAMERDEFLMFYQPIVDGKSQRINMVEALVRWDHPTNGLISPASFIPVAEETGLIHELGELVLRKACEQHCAWVAQGLPKLMISVNLSTKQFIHRNLLETIHRVLDETGMDPRYLQIEITESFAVNNIEYIIYILNELRNLGISIAVDDFGTGYSSVNYLKILPIDTLKLDKSFIHELDANPTQREIVKALISLSHGLGLLVTAEGVENQAQLEFLQKKHCDKFQGYFFSRPIPPQEFEELFLAGWNNKIKSLMELGYEDANI